MKKTKFTSGLVILFLLATGALSLTINSCGLESGADPEDPCKGIKCNPPYTVPVQTASTVCQCSCGPGFTGPDCTEFDHGNCDFVECYHGGVRARDGDYCYCNCPEGWGGEFCEIQTVACPGVECPEGQTPDPEQDCQCK